MHTIKSNSELGQNIHKSKTLLASKGKMTLDPLRVQTVDNKTRAKGRSHPGQVTRPITGQRQGNKGKEREKETKENMETPHKKIPA